MGFVVRSRLREDPVGSYPAFSPLPSTTPYPNRGRIVLGGLFSETLSVTLGLLPPGPPVFTGHAALWCSDFPLAGFYPRQRSPATRPNLP